MTRKSIVLKVIYSVYGAPQHIQTRHAAAVSNAIINAVCNGHRRRGLIASPRGAHTAVHGTGIYDVLQRVNIYTDEIVGRVAVYQINDSARGLPIAGVRRLIGDIRAHIIDYTYPNYQFSRADLAHVDTITRAYDTARAASVHDDAVILQSARAIIGAANAITYNADNPHTPHIYDALRALHTAVNAITLHKAINRINNS